MKYKCIPCNHEFEVKKGAKPRCPQCLNIHDVERITDDRPKQTGSKKPRVVPIMALLVIVGGGVGYYAVTQTDRGNKTDSGDASPQDVQTLLDGLDIAKADATDPCAVTPAIEAFAKKATNGEDGEEGMDALYNALVELKKSGKWRPYHQREPRKEGPLSADKLLATITGKTDGTFKALSYELACLTLAAGKSRDIDVQMVEISSYKGAKRPADPAGKLGRFGVVLGPVENGTSSFLYDVYGGRSKSAAKANILPLGAGPTMAPYFGINALSLLVRQEMSEALKMNDAAVKLDPDNPYFRAGRGFIFATTGVPDEALMEFEKALKKRNDPVQKTNLAEILLLVNPMDARAESEVQAAIDAMPDFARAHALKGMIHLMRQEFEPAETELGLAERLDPKSPAVAMYWARYHAARMSSDEAVAKAKDAVRLSENSVSSLLALAGIYREVARFDDMRDTLDQVFEKVETASMATQIKQLFGYDPSEIESDDDEMAESDQGDDEPDYELKLGEGMGKGPGSGLKLGGGGLGGGGLGGGGLGGGGKGLGGNLKLDMNLPQ